MSATSARPPQQGPFLHPRQRVGLTIFGGLALIAIVAGLSFFVGRHDREDGASAASPGPSPPGTVRIALCQFDVVGHNPSATLERAIGIVRKAFDSGATYVFLPELTLHGTREVTRPDPLAHSLEESPAVAAMSRLSREHRGYVVINLLHRNGEKIFNSSIVMNPDGRVIHAHHKTMLANVDRKGGLSAGREYRPVATPHGTMGILICRESERILRILRQVAADEAAGLMSVPPPDYWLAQAALAAYRGVDLLLIQMAFPGLTDTRTRDPYVGDKLWEIPGRVANIALEWAALTGARVMVVNKTGAARRHRYGGHSCAVTPRGRMLALAGYRPYVLYLDLPLDAKGQFCDDTVVAPSEPFLGWSLPQDPE
jgi:predicted amidohydrolase